MPIPIFNTSDLLEALRKRHEGEAWAFMTEVPDATGMNHRRWADAVAMSLWPSRGLELHGFEIKASRSDWQRELADPAKAESVCRYCDRWWIVAADAKIVRRDELPGTWGLLLPDAKCVLRAEVQAPKLKAIPVDRAFLCGLLRAATKLGNRATATALRKEHERGRQSEVEQHERVTRRLTEAHTDLERRVRQFEDAAGFSISTRWGSDAAKTGQIVCDVLAGKHDRDREELEHIRRIAAGIVERIDVELPAEVSRNGSPVT